MPAKNHDLHGNVPDTSPVALLLIDVINDLEFEGAEKLLKPAMRAAARIAALAAKARKRRIPVIYANDNFGRWRSDFREVVDHCLQDGVRGQPLVELLEPQRGDYFVLKPKHSAFFSTTLEMLLEYLGAKRVVLTGISGDRCVLLTAADAYLRDLELFVPADCTASISPVENRKALQYIRRVFHADTGLSRELNLARLARR
ncbi:MAG TPA: isochorismatase family cysteine hydrolase [Burkholderiales bacterium]|nr:isochorismatase family cysteine hydrolase [Burkholderiales bacterium]